ncbi:MAG: hypothetical protein ACI82A_003510 [Candidatus Azotimanducaceae bacterium]|jgi:hypothetical protein
MCGPGRAVRGALQIGAESGGTITVNYLAVDRIMGQLSVTHAA